MPRYVTMRPRAGYDPETMESWDDAHGIAVFETEESPVETGLYDANGMMLYRLPPERRPIGFHVRRRVRVKAGSRKV